MEINERVAIVEQAALSAHKRLDDHKVEIDSLRESRHEINGTLHNHSGLLSGLTTTMSELSVNVDKLTKFADKLTWITLGGLSVGTVLVGGLFYLVKQVVILLMGVQ